MRPAGFARRSVIGLLLLACCASAAEQRGGAVAVLYPDIGGAYRSVLASVIDGIEDRTHSKSIALAVSAETPPAALQAELRRQDVKVVIALGRHAIKAGMALDGDIRVIGGGVLNAADADLRRLHVSTLAPDPALLFARLKAVAPRTRRIHVVYDPQQNAWLARLAQRAARALGMELALHEAADIKAAMHHYQAVLSGMDSATDALWLPQDSVTVQDALVMPLVLRSAWANNLAVFSSSLGHVKQGVLFAMYPNNAAYGRQLGTLAQSALSTGAGAEPGLAPLRELSSAINVATLSHLQIKLGSRLLQDFDQTFPE